MKKFIKNNLKLMIGLIIGAILAGGIVYAATSAKDVTYTTAKNGSIKNVEEALNDLYNKRKEPFVWLNTNAIDTGTIECNVSKYTKAVIFCEYTPNNQYTGTTSSIIVDIEINNTINMTGMNVNSQLTYSKPITFKENSIEIGTGTYTGVITGSGCGFVNGIILY